MRGPTSRSGTPSRSPPRRRGRFFAGRPARARAVPFFQPKLTIGAPGDRFEQEADRVADRVVAGETAPEVQRMCAGCAEEGDEVRRQPMEEEEEMLQARPDGELRRQPMEEEEEMLMPSKAAPAAGGARTPATSHLAQGIDGLRGGGRPLGRGERAFFEPRLGRDLSAVRLHTGGRAAELASSINARAFTVGSDVFFGTAQYAPAAREGRHLLAHELTHVVQQRGGPPVARRKVAFDKPAVARWTRWNPIDRIVRGEEDVGRTSPTIDGTEPADLAAARRLVFKALRPRTITHNTKTGECQFDDFNSTLSAKVRVPTLPGQRGWRKYVEGADIKGPGGVTAVCGSQRTVPVRMIGESDNKAIVKWVEGNEQAHVDDLEKVHKDRIATYFTDMLALRATDPDETNCLDKLLAALGTKDGVAAKDFGDDWQAAVKKRDAKGGHDLQTKWDVKGRCSRITITSKPRS